MGKGRPGKSPSRLRGRAASFLLAGGPPQEAQRRVHGKPGAKALGGVGQAAGQGCCPAHGGIGATEAEHILGPEHRGQHRSEDDGCEHSFGHGRQECPDLWEGQNERGRAADKAHERRGGTRHARDHGAAQGAADRRTAGHAGNDATDALACELVGGALWHHRDDGEEVHGCEGRRGEQGPVRPAQAPEQFAPGHLPGPAPQPAKEGA
mmetsp:Transcript_102376/g.330199  ORF Transcript_102376/g.330199 Transcript_102376/m.330199 type:complete len:208 (+) Transcript_102376:133-756(+)